MANLKPELLAPAGNLEKLKLCFYYGADAVYFGGKQFSLRSFADNFTEAEISEAAAYTHALGKKLYAAVNIFPKNGDIPSLIKYLAFLKDARVDGIILSDPGVLVLAKQYAAGVPLHLSTQANTQNAVAAQFWRENGIQRIILARELSFSEMAETAKANPGVELEAFVHGAMCVSYSGRCLLSNYFTHRDGNRGACVQSCRWNYTLTENTLPGARTVDVEEDARGTYFMNSKDLNLIARIGELADAGIASFKIEGRMKSEFYLAGVVNVYRRAIDEYAASGTLAHLKKYQNELNKITNRKYTECFYSGPETDTISLLNEQETGTSEFIAAVLSGGDGRAFVEMRNRFQQGDTLSVLSPGEHFGKSFAVEEMTDEHAVPVTDAKLVQQRLYIKTPLRLQKGDILRRDKF